MRSNIDIEQWFQENKEAFLSEDLTSSFSRQKHLLSSAKLKEGMVFTQEEDEAYEYINRKIQEDQTL